MVHVEITPLMIMDVNIMSSSIKIQSKHLLFNPKILVSTYFEQRTYTSLYIVNYL